MSVDWTSIFYPSLGLAEVVVRGSIMYLALFAILRFVGRRQSGHFGQPTCWSSSSSPTPRRTPLARTISRSQKVSSWC